MRSGIKKNGSVDGQGENKEGRSNGERGKPKLRRPLIRMRPLQAFPPPFPWRKRNSILPSYSPPTNEIQSEIFSIFLLLYRLRNEYIAIEIRTFPANSLSFYLYTI